MRFSRAEGTGSGGEHPYRGKKAAAINFSLPIDKLGKMCYNVFAARIKPFTAFSGRSK